MLSMRWICGWDRGGNSMVQSHKLRFSDSIPLGPAHVVQGAIIFGSCLVSPSPLSQLVWNVCIEACVTEAEAEWSGWWAHLCVQDFCWWYAQAQGPSNQILSRVA